jgi:hypothetical protein
VVTVTVPARDSHVFRVVLGEHSREGLILVTVTVPARDNLVFRTVFMVEHIQQRGTDRDHSYSPF